MKINPKVFLAAAKRQFDKMTATNEGLSSDCTNASCLNVSDAAYELGIPSEDYRSFYKFYFDPKLDNNPTYWWPRLSNGKFDYEPRIIALLLACEIAKDKPDSSV